ncbi:MAG: futalosine hydrolase [Bacteroidota bacterium]
MGEDKEFALSTNIFGVASFQITQLSIMRILIVSATPFEIVPLRDYLEHEFEQKEENIYVRADLEVQILVTGVGQMLTAFAMGSILSQKEFDLLINAGVAGAFDRRLQLGAVVQVASEQFGDLGAEEKDGRFLSIHDLKLIDDNEVPFQDGKLLNTSSTDFDFLPKASGLTVNKVHGNTASIEQIQEKYNAQIESMEGIAFFYAALMSETPFLEIRAISNYVEARNRESWALGLAIDRLNEVLVKMLNSLLN